MYEDKTFDRRALAALVASKVYYHLGELQESLQFALGAGDLFDMSKQSEYVDTIIGACVDEYIRLRRLSEDKPATDGASLKPATIDPRLINMVEKLFESALESLQFTHVIGIALESRRLDIVQRALDRSGPAPWLCRHVGRVAETLSLPPAFRTSLLQLLLRVYEGLATSPENSLTDVLAILELHESLQQVKEAAQFLIELSEKAEMAAYQLALHLADNGSQAFRTAVWSALGDETTSSANGEPTLEQQRRRYRLRQLLLGDLLTLLTLDFLARRNRADLQLLINILAEQDGRSAMLHSAFVTCHAFMAAGTTAHEFVSNELKKFSGIKNWALFHAAASMGVLYQGHLLAGMDLLQPFLQADSSFSKGGYHYALGLVYANHGATSSSSSSVASNATLMPAPIVQKSLTVRQSVQQKLLAALSSENESECVHHGASLGLGLAMLATADVNCYEQLRAILYGDKAVAGEGAALGVGLLYAGTNAKEPMRELLAYGQDTVHLKITRSCLMAVAMMLLGIEQEALPTIHELLSSSDAAFRYGAMFAIGMAFAGTGSDVALQMLLHAAVTDSDDNVRRSAAAMLGLVLCRQPERMHIVAPLLSASYHPHVRGGACLAVGIAAAGQGASSPQLLQLLLEATEDGVDHVRQAACMGLGLLCQQVTAPQNEGTKPASPTPAGKASSSSSPSSSSASSGNGGVAAARERLITMATAKREEPLAKWGALIGLGMADAGGRNQTVQWHSPTGRLRHPAVIGMSMVVHSWCWHPFIHFFALALRPACCVALRSSSWEMPAVNLTVLSPPSLFAYPPPTKGVEKSKVTKAPAALLSTAVRQRKRERRRVTAGQSGSGGNGGNGGVGNGSESVDASGKKDGGPSVSAVGAAGGSKGASGVATSATEEPTTHQVENPTRVLGEQVNLMQWPSDVQAVVPQMPIRGVVMVDGAALDALSVVKPIFPEVGEMLAAMKSGGTEIKREEVQPEAVDDAAATTVHAANTSSPAMAAAPTDVAFVDSDEDVL